jgi:Mg-chelatase subunit ChlD
VEARGKVAENDRLGWAGAKPEESVDRFARGPGGTVAATELSLASTKAAAKDKVASLTAGELATAEKLHQKQGNVGLSDGSVQLLSGARLREQFRNNGDTSRQSLLEVEQASATPPNDAKYRNGLAPDSAGKPVVALGKETEEVTKGITTVIDPATGLPKLAEADADGVTKNPAVPGLGDVPLVGRLFRSETLARDEVNKKLPAPEPPISQVEINTVDNAYSTFSLNVSDVSYKLAAAALEKGALPDRASIRSEEFLNAFDYRDPEPVPPARVGFNWERARHPFAHNRDLLRFSVRTAAQGRQPGRPLNVVLLLDSSGSMERADRVSIIREALVGLAGYLQAQDRFSIVTFSRTARLVADGIPGNDVAKAVWEVAQLTPEGGTNLEEALKLGYQTALRHYLANGVNRVLLLTDGAANLGNVSPEALKQIVETYRRQGVALDCFGIGWEGYNDDLLEVLSHNGDGRYGFINTPEEAATDFASQLAGTFQVTAADVKVQVEFNPGRVITYRQVGYTRHQLRKDQFRDNTVDAAEIGAAESGDALYVIQVNAQGTGPVGTVRGRYKIPGTAEVREEQWLVPYTGPALEIQESSPAMRLATVAGMFAEWLEGNPNAAEVKPDALSNLLNGLHQIYGPDTRPAKLEAMLRQAKSVAGQ